VPETRRLQTCAAQKGRSLSKETIVRWQYEIKGPGLHVPSRNTGRGVHGCGKPKGLKPVGVGKPICAQLAKACEVQSLKGLGVTALRLETERSSPGQSEARRKLSGGSQGF